LASSDANRIVSLERWSRLCTAAELTDADAEFAWLKRAWRSFGRRYHTLAHLAACLWEFDGARQLAQAPEEVELALWFHDAVYRTWRKDNEQRSAERASRFLLGSGGDSRMAARVHQMILATAHVADPRGSDAALVVDIDLSVLGQSATVYDEFERNVRREYWWVPRRRFVEARCAILRSFLARPHIFHWPELRARYESAARANIERALRTLTAGTSISSSTTRRIP